MRKNLLLVFAFLLPLTAHARDLQWTSFVVDARLDAEGRLHVVERQTMLFTGDWNGGERVFNLGSGQRLIFEEMYRIAPSGEKIRMRAGGTSRIDDYQRVDEYTVRWRSRMPEDPPFEQTSLVYELHYTYDKILLPQGGTSYLLDHDFAFSRREGPILAFRVNLDLDRVWKSGPTFVRSHDAEFLAPGRGYVLTVPLTYAGPGAPAGVRIGAPRWLRLGAIALLVAGLLAIAMAFVLSERRKGRFVQLSETVDEAWLEQHVFSLEPAVAGALWDRSTGASEVAAILAKLTQEKKITSEVSYAGLFRGPEMKMTWHGGRDDLLPHERVLVDALFFNGKHTSTAKIRERYKRSGFDPVSKISTPLSKIVEQHPAWKEQRMTRAWIPALAILLVSMFILMTAAARNGGNDGQGAFAVGFASILVALFGSGMAHSARHAVARVPLRMAAYSVPTLLHAAIAATFLLLDDLRIAGFSAFAYVLVVLSCYALVTTMARIPATADGLFTRRRLELARDYFKRQLRSPNPQLKDEWMPWLIALGLGRQVDWWVRRFSVGAASAHIGGPTLQTVPSTHSSATASVSAGRGLTFSGGGGAFGGAGATGSWAVAAGAIASGVSSPSSGGSGGGGGGGGGGSSSSGGSSGGGGGGGW